MKKLILIMFVLFTGFVPSHSQDSIFRLHTAVGDTIDKHEKNDFDLFPEFKNSDFKFGIIYSNGETKNLKVYTQNDSATVKQLDPAKLAEYQSNIDKLLILYSSENRKDTTALNERFTLYNFRNEKSLEIKKLNIDNSEIEKSAFEGRRQQDLVTRALESGLSGQKVIDAQNYGIYGEIKFKKKKK